MKRFNIFTLLITLSFGVMAQSTNMWELTDTWTDAGITYDAIKMDVTDTLSAADSKLFNLQKAGISFYYIHKSGSMFMAEQASAPADVAGFGQFVIKNTIPNTAFFVDDIGGEFQIGISAGGDLKADGTIPLTADWDIGAFDITGEQFHSDIVTGTPPFTVVSTTVVANLKAANAILADTVTTNANLTGHVTSVGNATVLGTFTIAQLSTAISDSTISGINTGDQTSIVGITGTSAQFNTANTDGSFAFSGGAFHDGFSDFVTNEHLDWSADQGATNLHSNNIQVAVTDRILGRDTAGAGVMEELTATAVKTILAINLSDVSDAADKLDSIWSEVVNANSTPAIGDRVRHTGLTLDRTATFPGTFIAGDPEIWVFNEDDAQNLTLTPALGDRFLLDGVLLAIDATHTLLAGQNAIVIPRTSSASWTLVIYGAESHVHILADVTDSGVLAPLNTVGTTEIDNSAVTYAKVQNVSATDQFLGRDTAGAGVIEEITATAARTILNVENGSTADQTSIVGITGTIAQFNTAITDATLSGNNTGDQTSIVGITGTKAQFDTAVTDGNVAYTGGAFHDGFSDFIANEHLDWTLGSVAGFDSLGIDDNATSEMLQLNDNSLVLGNTSAFSSFLASNTISYLISGGNVGAAGSNITFYGGAHATLANDVRLRGGSTNQLYYDDSASSFNFQDNSILVTQNYIELEEMTVPGNAGTNKGRLYLDNTGAKSKLMIVFQSGAAIQIAIEP